MGWTVVCDRHVIDTMVDMACETRRPEIHKTMVGRFFMAAIPKKTKMVILTGDSVAIGARKEDLKYDGHFEKKYKIFYEFQKDLDKYSHWIVDTTSQGVDAVFESVLECLSNDNLHEPRKWAEATRHILCQGLLYMDSSERLWRLACLAFIAGLFLFPIKILLKLGWALSILIALLLAHLANFVLNSTFWATVICDLKFFPPRGKRFLYRYLKGLRKRVAACDAIMCYCAFGSIARDDFHDASDLDMLLIRKPGIINALRVFNFVLAERLYSLFHKVPIELWVGDSTGFLNRLRPDEVPIVIINKDKTLDGYYRKTQTIEEAIEANGDSYLFSNSALTKEHVS